MRNDVATRRDALTLTKSRGIKRDLEAPSCRARLNPACAHVGSFPEITYIRPPLHLAPLPRHNRSRESRKVGLVASESSIKIARALIGSLDTRASCPGRISIQDLVTMSPRTEFSSRIRRLRIWTVGEFASIEERLSLDRNLT